MKRSRVKRKAAAWTKPAPIRTNLMEIIGELSKLTDDDNLVVAAVKSMIRSYNLRTTRLFTPVKLATSANSGEWGVRPVPLAGS